MNTKIESASLPVIVPLRIFRQYSTRLAQNPLGRFPPELMPDTDYHEQVSYEKAFFDNLAKCTGLESLNIQHLGAFDSSFLTKLPKLYYFRISGEDSETEIGQERLAYYEKHPEHYEGLHCVVIDDRWVVNEE